jgi:hypothetical protein
MEPTGVGTREQRPTSGPIPEMIRQEIRKMEGFE